MYMSIVFSPHSITLFSVSQMLTFSTFVFVSALRFVLSGKKYFSFRFSYSNKTGVIAEWWSVVVLRHSDTALCLSVCLSVRPSVGRSYSSGYCVTPRPAQLAAAP